VKSDRVVARAGHCLRSPSAVHAEPPLSFNAGRHFQRSEVGNPDAQDFDRNFTSCHSIRFLGVAQVRTTCVRSTGNLTCTLNLGPMQRRGCALHLRFRGLRPTASAKLWYPLPFDTNAGGYSRSSAVSFVPATTDGVGFWELRNRPPFSGPCRRTASGCRAWVGDSGPLRVRRTPCTACRCAPRHP